MKDQSEIGVTDNARRRRYELSADGALAGFITYRTEPGAVVLMHTEVDPQFEGRGLGSRLVRGALDDIRARGVKVVPVCPFVRAYLERHPEQRDLVAATPQS
jgi:predicted GNAT family acetyltransferase